MMNSREIYLTAKRAGIPNFVGVYSVNTIPTVPPTQPPPINFVVNNQTANLPGQHWISVSIDREGGAYIYDPLGWPPPSMLVHNLQRNLNVHTIDYNRHQVQKLGTENCGQLVLEHLINKTQPVYS